MRLVIGLAGLLGQAVADQCYTCTERFDSNGVPQTDNRLVIKKKLYFDLQRSVEDIIDHVGSFGGDFGSLQAIKK